MSSVEEEGLKRRVLTGRHEMHQGVNATPLIDIVMCLIIFFLLVGKMAHDRSAAVRLPESASGKEEASASVVVVTVTPMPADPIATGMASAREGGFAGIGVSVEVDGEAVSDSKALEGAVRKKLAGNAEASVQLRGDRDLSMAAIGAVMRACGNAGARSIRLATERTG